MEEGKQGMLLPMSELCGRRCSVLAEGARAYSVQLDGAWSVG